MQIQLFITCLLDSLYPEVGVAAVEVLERLGVQVTFPLAQTCCGQPAYNAGFRPEARAVARRMLEVFDGDDPVVTPSGSCAAMLKHGFPDLFRDDPALAERAHRLAARTYEFSQFIVDVLGVDDVGARWNGKLAYHASCHLLRGMGVAGAPRKLLAHVHGAEIAELAGHDECCGFGGLFAVKFGELSGAILARKIENIRASGAVAVVTCDAGCLTHINGGLSRARLPLRVVHLAEVLRSSQ